MISIKNVVKRFGNFNAVNDLSLEIQSGEIFAFLGVNGAGKTTTIKMMTGILRPTSGSISIGGHNIVDDPISAKSITGFVPDRPQLYNKLTGRELLYFVSELYSVPISVADPRIDQLLEEYGLLDWQDELTESYSHGMKQRLATCAALVHDPKILILDEPMVGLDPHGSKLLKDAIQRYARAGKTVFLSTHSLNVAEEVADRIAIINKGALIKLGTLDEIQAGMGITDYNLEEIFLELTTSEVI